MRVVLDVNRRNGNRCVGVSYFFLPPDFLEAFIANEYSNVPAIAMEDPMIDPVLMGVLKAMTEATMITTRLMVLPTACVTGLTLPSAKKATSL